MIEYLENFIARKKDELKALEERNESASTVEELRSLGASMKAVRDEIMTAETALTDARKAKEEEPRKLFPAGSYQLNIPGTEARSSGPYSTMEYRTAFKDYVQKGTPIPSELRAGGDPGTTVAADIGAIIPTTVMDEFIKDASKVYGTVYSRVRKLNVQGGVEFPVSKLKATFKWVTETTPSGKQKAGNIDEKVTFSYHTGEIRLAQTLLSQVVSLDVFESEITKILVEAYVEAMDKGIISGTGSGQLLGITKDPRVKNVVQMSAENFADWTAWRKNLFAKLPLSKRGKGEFLFSAATVESYLLTMKDKNDRPLFREAAEASAGNLEGSFFGRDVYLVEPDVITDFDTAAVGDIVGVYWVPTDYAINSNLQFGVKRYIDEDTNEYINKGLTIVDGKILDTAGCWLIKKAASTPTPASGE